MTLIPNRTKTLSRKENYRWTDIWARCLQVRNSGAWSGLRIAREVTGKDVPGRRLGKRICIAWCWLLTGGLSLSPHGLLPCWLNKCFHDPEAGFAQNEWSKRQSNQDRSHNAFEWSSVQSYTPLLTLYSVRNESLSRAHTQGEGTWTPPLAILKYLWTVLKPSHSGG